MIDYAVIHVDDLPEFMEQLNRHGGEIVSATQDRDCYTIFFKEGASDGKV